jgi:hypothetical protein
MKIEAQCPESMPSSDDAFAPAKGASANFAINEDERARGEAMFHRADDAERFRLVEAVVDDFDSEAFSLEVAAGILRCAWDSEPYVGGVRAGNYLTALGFQKSYVFDHLEELLEHFGSAMMMPEERDELASMEFPITVFRGGTGDPRLVAMGMSWTLSRETADFFAYKWPARWGNQEAPVVLRREVDRDDVAAYFNDRAECEVVVSHDDSAPFVVITDQAGPERPPR